MRSVLLAFVLLHVLAIASVAAAGEVGRPVLRHRDKRISLRLNSSLPEVDQSRVRTAIELQLRKASFTVGDEIKSNKRPTQIEVVVGVSGPLGGGPVACAILVRLRDYVLYPNDTGYFEIQARPDNAKRWSTPRRMGEEFNGILYENTGHVGIVYGLKDVLSATEASIDEFLNDFLEANPPKDKD